MQFQESLHSQVSPNQLMKAAWALKWPSAWEFKCELIFDTKNVNMKSTEAASSNVLMTFAGLVSNAKSARSNSLSHKAITMHLI